MGTVVGYILIIAGLMWFLWSFYTLKKEALSENWLITTGVITKSVVSEPIREGSGTSPIIHYSYSVNGKHYKSDRVTWGNFHLSGSKGASEQVVSKYKEGSKVKIYYNPNNVRESVLEPGAASGTMLSLVVSCIPIVAGIVQLFTGFFEIG